MTPGLSERSAGVDGLQRNSHESAARSDASMYAAVDPVHTQPGCMYLRHGTYFFAFQSRFTSKLMVASGRLRDAGTRRSYGFRELTVHFKFDTECDRISDRKPVDGSSRARSRRKSSPCIALRTGPGRHALPNASLRVERSIGCTPFSQHVGAMRHGSLSSSLSNSRAFEKSIYIHSSACRRSSKLSTRMLCSQCARPSQDSTVKLSQLRNLLLLSNCT